MKNFGFGRRNALALWTALLLLLYPVISASAASYPAPPPIQAEAGVLLDLKSGAILYEKNMHAAYYPASITKLLTALIVVENCRMDEVITFSHNAVYNVEAGSSSAAYDEGDTLTVRDALYAMLLKSANEVSNALAEHCGGSIEGFAAMMNEKAASLGCGDSHFSNPSGLNDPDHYTSAHDFALIAAAAFSNPLVMEIDSATYYNLPPSRNNPEGLTVYAHHAMLRKNSENYYAPAVCGKTGYTSLAGNTLVTYAREGEMELVAVILKSNKTHYSDTKTLFHYGFSSFSDLPLDKMELPYRDALGELDLIPEEEGYSLLRFDDSGFLTLPAEADMTAIESRIQYDPQEPHPDRALARVDFIYDSIRIGSAYLVSSYPSERTRDTPQLSQSEAAVAEPAPTDIIVVSSQSPDDLPLPEGITGTIPTDTKSLKIAFSPLLGIPIGIILLVGIYLLVRYLLTRKRADSLSGYKDWTRSTFQSNLNASVYISDRKSRRRKSFFK